MAAAWINREARARCPTGIQPPDFEIRDLAELRADSVASRSAGSRASQRRDDDNEEDDMATTRKVIIIGSGPAGYTAAIYAARANLAPVMFTGIQAGGQLMLTTLVENYPGFVDGIDGPPLMETFQKQAERFGTEMIADDVTEVDFRSRPVHGHRRRRRPSRRTPSSSPPAPPPSCSACPTSPSSWGAGVSTCATCDGFFFKDQNIMVVGGGDSALEEALYLSRLGRKVEVVHRRDTLRASKIMQERALKNPKIAFIWNTVVEDVLDPGRGQGDRRCGSGTSRPARSAETPVDGLFVAIGHQPNTALFKGQIDLHPNEYIKVDAGDHPDLGARRLRGRATSQDFTYRQAVTAAGTGCMAALEAERYLEAEGLGD